MIKLLITDLDDTLYPWVDFFIPAFYAMVDELAVLLKKDSNLLLDEYRKIHQEKGSLEFPYASVFLPSVLAAFPELTQDELIKALNPVFHKFNSVRKKLLHLYPNVKESLEELLQMGILIVGYTESAEENGYYRLRKLGIAELFHKVFVSSSQFSNDKYPHPSKIRTVVGKKPNPEILKQICTSESIELNEAIYIGDSLTKDIYMANKANVQSVLFRAPCDPAAKNELYKKLVAVSHWQPEDFNREAELHKICQQENIRPDYLIHSFDKIVVIIKSINKTQ